MGVQIRLSVCFASDVPYVFASKTDVTIIDLSTGAFEKLTNGDLGAGVATIDWYVSINKKSSGLEAKS